EPSSRAEPSRRADSGTSLAGGRPCHGRYPRDETDHRVVVDDGDRGEVVVVVVVDFFGTVVAVEVGAVAGGSAGSPVVGEVVLGSGSVAVVDEDGPDVVVDDDVVVVDVASGPTSDNPSLSGEAVGMSLGFTP